MSVKRAMVWCFVMTALAVAVSLWIGPTLPDQVPTHWDINGKADAWGSKWINLLIMPAFMAVFAALIVVLPKISPKNFDPLRFEPTWNFLMVAVEGLFLALHLIILQATRTGTFDMQRLMPAAIFAFFVIMGNVLGRVKRNFWMGVRTPWTLADERVWDATHRAAGRLWFIWGLVGLVMSLLGVAPWMLLSLLLVIALLPVAHSYVLWRRLGNGQPTT